MIVAGVAPVAEAVAVVGGVSRAVAAAKTVAAALAAAAVLEPAVLLVVVPVPAVALLLVGHVVAGAAARAPSDELVVFFALLPAALIPLPFPVAAVSSRQKQTQSPATGWPVPE